MQGGDIPKALDICFKGQLFEVLRNIADDLGETTNPGTSVLPFGMPLASFSIYRTRATSSGSLSLLLRLQLYHIPTPGVLRQCATFFIDNDQYEKGAHLLVTAKEFDSALKICLEHKVGSRGSQNCATLYDF